MKSHWYKMTGEPQDWMDYAHLDHYYEIHDNVIVPVQRGINSIGHTVSREVAEWIGVDEDGLFRS